MPTLQVLQEASSTCTGCSLSRTRKNVVFGSGPSDATIMLIGEAPGQQEDEQGVPFIGRAGNLLDKMLKAINLDRKNIYITNTIKCRPPNNRDPTNSEVQACSSYLDKQIELINPRVIVTTGLVATKRLLGQQDIKMGAVRGKLQDSYKYKGRKIFPIYHPAYLLRNPSSKIQAWEDLKQLQTILETPNG